VSASPRKRQFCDTRHQRRMPNRTAFAWRSL
jgi:hypothetical protein